jgi:hypothetical protein
MTAKKLFRADKRQFQPGDATALTVVPEGVEILL